MSFSLPCPAGCEDLLEAELRHLGAAPADLRRAHGAVLLGPAAPALGHARPPDAALLDVALRACLHSRIASRVLLGLGRFSCALPQDLHAGVRALPWPEWLAPKVRLAIDCPRGEGELEHTLYAAQVAKDGIVDAMRAATGERPDVDLRNPDVRIHVLLRRGEATVSLDLAGEGLHRRGYRLQGGHAPLKENLAAAMLLRAGWPERAAQGAHLVDPMCGTGTLLTEAAWLAVDMPPSVLRKRYALTHWRGLPQAAWARARAEADAQAEAARARLAAGELRGRLRGFDVHGPQLELAQRTLAGAGLEAAVTLARADITELTLTPAEGPGMVVCNPPYGERLGADEAALQATYAALGSALRRYPAWSAHVLVGELALGRALGLRATRKHALRNGPLHCNLLHFAPRPHAEAQAGEAGGNGRGARPSARTMAPADAAEVQMLQNRLQKNKRRLEAWRQREQVTAYRIYDADLPEYNAAVDVYDSVDGIRRLHVQEYRAPIEVPEAKAQARLRLLLAALPEVLDVAPTEVVLKQRRQTRPGAQYGQGGAVAHAPRPERRPDRYFQVLEGGLRLWVSLDAYLDTGLYLDHRTLRAELRAQAAGKDVLNLFCYTGAVTVAMADGGARNSTSVDLSKTYLTWAHNNLVANGLDEPRHELVHADVQAFLSHAHRAGPRYDLVFCGPPTFTNSRRAEEDFDVLRDHAQLIDAVMALVRPGGELVFSSHARRLKLLPELFDRYVTEDVSDKTRPVDFARGRPHQTFRLRHRGR